MVPWLLSACGAVAGTLTGPVLDVTVIPRHFRRRDDVTVGRQHDARLASASRRARRRQPRSMTATPCTVESATGRSCTTATPASPYLSRLGGRRSPHATGSPSPPSMMTSGSLVGVDRRDAEPGHAGRPVVPEDDGLVAGSSSRQVRLDVVVGVIVQVDPQIVGGRGACPALDVAVEPVRLLRTDDAGHDRQHRRQRRRGGQPSGPRPGHHGITCAEDVP